MIAKDIRGVFATLKGVAAELSAVIDGGILPYGADPADLTPQQMTQTNHLLAALGGLDGLPADDATFDKRAADEAASLARTASLVAAQLAQLVEGLYRTRRALIDHGVPDAVTSPVADLEGRLIDIGTRPRSGDMGVPLEDLPVDHPVRGAVGEADLPVVPGRGRVLAVPTDWRHRPWAVRGRLRNRNRTVAAWWRTELADRAKRDELARLKAEEAERERLQRRSPTDRVYDLEQQIAQLLAERGR